MHGRTLEIYSCLVPCVHVLLKQINSLYNALVSTTHINAKATPINNTDYNWHTKAAVLA